MLVEAETTRRPSFDRKEMSAMSTLWAAEDAREAGMVVGDVAEDVEDHEDGEDGEEEEEEEEEEGEAEEETGEEAEKADASALRLAVATRAALSAWLSPKSQMRTPPRDVSSTFSGLRSLCTMLRLCRYFMPAVLAVM